MVSPFMIRICFVVQEKVCAGFRVNGIIARSLNLDATLDDRYIEVLFVFIVENADYNCMLIWNAW